MLEKDSNKTKSVNIWMFYKNQLWETNMIIPIHSYLQSPLWNKCVPKISTFKTINFMIIH